MEQILLLFADTRIQTEENNECIELINACDMEISAIFQQQLKKISFRTYIGRGKCEEIRQYVMDHDIDRIVCNQDLSPLQIRNLEEMLLVPVMDRTELIIEIFKKRAKTPIAKLQVESAELKKLLPRLIGANIQLGRQSGSGQNKGSGEKQLEMDRRRIKARLHEVEAELKQVSAQRATQRRLRSRSHLPLVALIGYTNAGKSTIMNMLLEYSAQKKEKHVLEKDMLFATLDTSIRTISLEHGHSFLLSDTVGFLNNLPHSLIKAFHSTLEEIQFADLLLHVVDSSSNEMTTHMEVTNSTLTNLQASDVPSIIVYNKCDKNGYTYPAIKGNEVYISAKEKLGIDELLQLLHQMLHPDEIDANMVLPYKETATYSFLMNHAHIYKREDCDDGMYLQLTIPKRYYEKYKQYMTPRSKES